MTRAIFRKQMMEVFSWLYRDKKIRQTSLCKRRCWLGAAVSAPICLLKRDVWSCGSNTLRPLAY